MSEIVGSVLTIAITIIAGSAVWGYVNGSAGASELQYANSVANTNNFLNENLKVVTISFPSTTQAAFWLYNTGTVTLQLSSVQIYDTSNTINLLYTNTNSIKDLRSGSGCSGTTATTSTESPYLNTVSVKPQNGILVTLGIPGSQSGCSSFGQTIAASGSGDAYAVIVTGIYGNQDSGFGTR
jgi:hypothetical protein